MERDEAVRLLTGGREGIREWNERREAGEPIPSLHSANLTKATLHFLSRPAKSGRLQAANLSGVDLSNANLDEAALFQTNLEGAVLTETCLASAVLSSANLAHANLTRADVVDALFSRTVLDGAILSGSSCDAAYFRDASLRGTCFSEAHFDGTVIDCDLSLAVGLDEIVHDGPSVLSARAMLSLRHPLPVKFLRGCGVPDTMIAYLESQTMPRTYFTCFISYSTADEAFATKLHDDFQNAGIRCWKWNLDARTGRDLWAEIDGAITTHDKVVLIASKSSLTSPAVGREVERALAQEDEREIKIAKGELTGTRDVLFPVRLDNYIFDKWTHPRKTDVTKKVIADATAWDTNPDKYQKVLQKLLGDLKAD
jgi:hypothetical protein